jgi:hypothetical protein
MHLGLHPLFDYLDLHYFVLFLIQEHSLLIVMIHDLSEDVPGNYYAWWHGPMLLLSQQPENVGAPWAQ